MQSILPYIQDERNRLLLSTVNSFSINAIPEDLRDEEEQLLFTITVERRGKDSWAVKFHNDALNKDLKTEYESLPSSRTDEFLNEFRFPLPEAISIAERAAERLTYRSVTVAEIIQHGSLVAAFNAIEGEGRKFAGRFQELVSSD